MLVKVLNEVFEKVPELKLGVLVAKNIDNTGTDEKIFHLLEEVEQLIKLEKSRRADLISTSRLIHEEFGFAEMYHTPLEHLLKEIGKLPRENKLVDVLHYISLRFMVPVIAQTKKKFDEDIIIGKADELKIVKGDLKAGINEKTKDVLIYVTGLPPIEQREIETIMKELSETIKLFCNGELTYHILDKDNTQIKI